MLILAEGLGALAVVINFVGYRQNNINRYRIITAFALLCVSVHFFLLGAMAAGIGCSLASVRNIVALRYQGRLAVLLFVLLNVLFLSYEWFILNNSWIILIAYSSSLIFTIGTFLLKDTMGMRQWFLLAEILGLAYALLVGSVFGSVFNSVNLLSILLKLKQDSRYKKTD